MSILPGEGAVIWNPGEAFRNTLVGNVIQGELVNELPAGFSLCSSMVPQEGRLTSDLWFPAAYGDAVFFLNPDGSYRRYDYWATGWHPEEPVVRVGEAFWSCKLAPTNWVRLFSVIDVYTLPAPSYRIRSFAAGPEVTTNCLHHAIPYLPAMPGPVYAAPTRSVQLRATALNPAGMNYQWRKSGATLTDGLRLTGAQNDTLVLTDLQKGADDGVYTVTATNAAGRIVAHAAKIQVVTPAAGAPALDHPVKTAGTLEHTLHVEPGAFYRMQSSPDLQAWTDVTNFTSAGSIFQLSLPAPTNGVRLFYRLASP